jgi:hypothetical protein
VVHVPGHHRGAEGDAGDDRHLGARVVALDVGGGIGLGVAEGLRLRQRVLVGCARLGHAGEDVVGRAVDDAHHPRDALAHERLAQRADDRDAPGHGRLEQQVDAGVLRSFEQLGPGRGEELLVAGDHRLAGLDGGEDEVARRVDAADHLDDHVDLGVGHHGVGVGGEQRGIDPRPAGLGEVAHRHPHHLES